MNENVPARTALLRGLMRRCPRCGEGAVFAGYLKKADACGGCGLRFDDIETDDGPAWLTVGLTVPFVILLMVSMETYATLPFWLEGAILVVAATVYALLILPVTKGFFLAALWLTKRQ